MKNVLVTGATGFVGSYVCKELLANGYKVRAMHRASSSTENLKGCDVEFVEGDIKDRASLSKAMQGMDGVIHIAALFREAKHPDSEYYAVNVDGTKNVIEEAAKAGVKRLVHCSTVGVHSHIPNPPANEDEDYRPGDIYQKTKCIGEVEAMKKMAELDLPGVVIRPAMIWGPGDTRTLKLFKGIARGRMPLIGLGNTNLHWIMVSDLARAFRLALEASTNQRVYIICGAQSVSMKELYQAIARRVGVKERFLRIPAFPIQVMGGICEAICRPMGIEPPLHRRRVDFFTKTRSFDGTRAKQELGFEPAGSLQDEVNAIVSWYQENKWL